MLEVMAAAIASLALLVSSVSLVRQAFSRCRRQIGRGLRAIGRSFGDLCSCGAAEDRRARTPQLTVMREGRASNGETAVIFSLRCTAPEDLDSVIVHRPVTEDGIKYPVALVGTDWSDSADLGAVPLGHRGRFILSVGSAHALPTFWVSIVCRSGADEWNLDEKLVVRRPGRVIVAG
ncbi:hypothetical protein ACOCJ7_00075 [Knoellia sp. CPCC 206453]|uniref:hypothetical protein n=1 Tax=Knoellia pratensis TaxID=3404796 RepID=UPI00361877E4